MDYIFIMKNGLFKLFLNGKFQGAYFITPWTLSDAKNDGLKIYFTN